MTKNIIVLAVYLCYCMQLYAQQNNLKDSLYIYHNQFNFRKSNEAGEKLIKLLSEKDKKDTAYSNILNIQFRNNLFLKNYKKCLNYAKEDSVLQENFKEKKDSIYYIINARAINNLGIAYKNLEEYKKAERCYLYVLEYSKSKFGEYHISYSNACNDIAILYLNISEWSKSEIFFRKGLQIDKKIIGDTHLDYALSCNNLGLLYQIIGNTEKAMEYYRYALNVFNTNKAYKNPRYPQMINNLATLYAKIGLRDSALSLYRRNLSVIESIDNKNHPDYFMTLFNIAKIYYVDRKIDSSEHYLHQIEANYEFSHNPQNMYNINLLKAKLFYAKKEYQKSDSILDSFIEKTERRDKTSHINSLIIKILANPKYNPEILKKVEKIYQRVLYDIENTIYAMSELEKEKFLEEYIYFARDVILLAAYTYNTPELNKYAYNIILATKGIVVTDKEKIKTRILNSNDTILKHQFITWKQLKNMYVKIQNLSSEELQKKKINPDRVKKELDSLEKEISIKSEVFNKTFKFKFHTWDTIQNALKEKQAAMEIFRINFADIMYHAKDSIIYGAVIIKKQDDSPSIVVLPNFNENSVLTNYRRSISSKIKDKETYQYLWLPLKQRLKGVKEIYFSAEGIYYQVNLNTLLNPATQKYVIDETKIIHLTCTRDILNKKNFITKNNYMIGNPKFDTGIEQENEKPKQERTFESFFENISQLEGAEKEVKQISDMLPNTKIVTGINATEEYVKSIKNPRILHIATHGYFIKGRYQSSTQAMLNAGLLFAGVVDYDRMDTHPLDKEDGKLTAFEVMNMELDSTELVVLSACETGLGQVSKEGVYGLQRAFKVAGAQTIIMSLWKVNDEATQSLMTKFYENWQKKKMDKRVAFETAQKEIRKEYKEPYYWGAFVIIE